MIQISLQGYTYIIVYYMYATLVTTWCIFWIYISSKIQLLNHSIYYIDHVHLVYTILCTSDIPLAGVQRLMWIYPRPYGYIWHIIKSPNRDGYITNNIIMYCTYLDCYHVVAMSVFQVVLYLRLMAKHFLIFINCSQGVL